MHWLDRALPTPRRLNKPPVSRPLNSICEPHPGCGDALLRRLAIVVASFLIAFEKWVRITRALRDGSTQDWWALEVVAGPYGPDKTERAIVASTDPQTLPDATTWYLVTNLPAPAKHPATPLLFAAASLEEVIRLYGLRMWVEQSYKQVKHALGWSQYQVRSDQAIRRHWQLVCCAFSFCWYHASHTSSNTMEEPLQPSEPEAFSLTSVPADAVGTGKKNQRGTGRAATGVLAESAASGERMVGTLDHAQALLGRVVTTAPTTICSASAHMA
jgi:hypothetical protein